MAIETFTRREQKYLITMEQYEKLLDEISLYMRPDRNGVDGCYTVTSLYFDTPEHLIYHETKGKLPFRQKLRLRVYDHADINSTAFFEVKQKHKKVVNKRRMLLPLHEAYEYLQETQRTDVGIFETSNRQVFKEINNFRNLYNLKPEMVVSYDRRAMHGIENDDFRMTFDFNLRCRNYDLFPENGPYGVNFINQNLVILEVKVQHSVPLWLTRILQKLNCEQKSASKYCTSFELLHDELAVPGSEKLLAGGF